MQARRTRADRATAPWADGAHAAYGAWRSRHLLRADLLPARARPHEPARPAGRPRGGLHGDALPGPARTGRRGRPRPASLRLSAEGLGYNRGQGEDEEMHEMHIYGVSFDLVGKQPIVLLKTADGNKFLPIWIGHPEAAAILMRLQGQS